MATTHPGVPREVDRYLVAAEKVIFLTRLHILTLAEPIGLAIAGLILLGILQPQAPNEQTRTVLMGIWLALTARAAWKLLEWYMTLFLATDRRLILVHGVFNRQVDMMPVSKVTDMRYVRSWVGYLFGFGKFLLESAGQDQALSVVPWVPRPDAYYRKIQEVLLLPAGQRTPARPTPTGQSLPVHEPGQWWS
ncbi:MAG TPA: PH domain-containing protein [Kineosporiaceae bacterium]|nr:PH domain-containing protein [Kineosporiaceae bacterium]